MTVEQFNKAKKIMEEKKELEEFLRIFNKGYRIRVVATEQASTSLDRDREYSIPCKRESSLYNDISKSICDRLHLLNEELEKI